ncbi:WD40 repeat domain-containing protein [Actinoplanes sp. CA-051413]|uniref:WD40 repeat domain-containing protein n=1 Tax=Actinoplanes sp. CA-051413 TaxID=3239899 RepID=UPI003D960D73
MVDGHADPVRTFSDRLRRLQAESGGPSVRDLVRLTAKIGAPYTRGTIHDKLAGRSVASWEFTEAFVRACALHTGVVTDPDLGPWREWHAEMARDIAVQRAGRRRTVKPDVCPYRGLESFKAEHAAWFHGRGVAVREIVDGLAEHRRGLVLLGPSGAGKSSVVQAGVLPALAEGRVPGSDDWTIVFARPGKDLYDALDGRSIVDAVAGHRAAGSRLLLVVDQFEELLTPGDGDNRGALDELTAAVGVPGMSLVLILRDDFYPQMAAEAPALLAALLPGLINVSTTLSGQDLREIITKPATAVGLECQDGLPERIIADVLAADRRATVTVLPLLELALEQLWQRRQDGMLTHEAYQRIGGIAGALTTWCDTAVEQLAGERQATARRILTALVRPADDERGIPAVRQQVPITALRRLAGGDEADEVLAALTDQRIVTTRTVGDVPVAELVHEALIRDWVSLREWVRQDHRFHDWLRRADEQHARWSMQHDAGDLLHGTDLSEGVDWATRRRLPENVDEFLTASRNDQRAGIRRTRALIAILATFLVVALAAAGLAWAQRQSAVSAERAAQSRQLAAQSATLNNTNPDLAALLAVQAYRTSPTDEATESVFAVSASPLRYRLDDGLVAEQTTSFSPDGRLLVTAGDDAKIRLWTMPGGRLSTVLDDHVGAVRSAEFSADGRTLATGGNDGVVRLWDVASARLLAAMPGHTDAIATVMFSRDGGTLVSRSLDKTIGLWDVPGRHRRAVLPAPDELGNYAYATAISPDGRVLAVSGSDGQVRLHDVLRGTRLRILDGRHAGGTRTVAFSPDGRILATAGEEGAVWISDVFTGRRLATIVAHTGGARAVSFSPDGRTLATGGDDRTVRLWRLVDHKNVVTIAGHGAEVNEVVFSRDGRTVITRTQEGIVRLWEVATGQLQVAIPGNAVSEFAVTRDGRTLATAGTNGTRLWDLAAGRSRPSLSEGGPNVADVTFSPNRRTLASSNWSGHIQMWDVASARPGRGFTAFDGGTPWLGFSPDGRTLLTASVEHGVRLWEAATGRLQRSIDGGVSATALARDGRTLATGGDDGKIRIWDVTTGGRLGELAKHTQTVESLEFSPDGRLLASSSLDHTVILWDVRRRAAVASLVGHTGEVYAIAFSPDGHTLATGSWDGVRLWEVATRRQLRLLTGHTQQVVSLAFSPDGRTLASGSYDRTTRLWDVATGLNRATLVGHSNTVTGLEFSPDGRLLVTGSWDGTVRLWDLSLPTVDQAIAKICRAVHRDLSPDERALYLRTRQTGSPVCD